MLLQVFFLAIIFILYLKRIYSFINTMQIVKAEKMLFYSILCSQLQTLDVSLQLDGDIPLLVYLTQLGIGCCSDCAATSCCSLVGQILQVLQLASSQLTSLLMYYVNICVSTLNMCSGVRNSMSSYLPGSELRARMI